MGDANVPPPDMDTPSCGTARPTILQDGTEGIVIARDGTIYISSRAGIHRITPEGVESNWLGFVVTLWGVALDETNANLYFASPEDSTIYAIATATAELTTLTTAVSSPNGLTLGPDGALYVSDFGAHVVYRVDVVSGATMTVTTSAIPRANGLAFAPGDPSTLYVLSYADGELLALTLDAAHTEIARRVVATSLGSPDGITLDDTNRFYITDNSGGRVIRLEADGTAPTIISTSAVPSAANLEFGVGVLDCHDLYVTSLGAVVRIAVPDAVSADLPWH